MQIQRSKISILIIIFKLIEKHHRSYCWPTRRTIQTFLSKYYGIDISIFCIDKHLKDLKDWKLIQSFRRYGQREDGTFFNKPSNRQLTKAGLSFLLKLGIRVSNWLKDLIFQKDKKPSRFSRKKVFPELERISSERSFRISEFSTIGDLLSKMPG